ncbi:MAG: DNA-3-methyladenine glycosylase 2 family protein [Alphaproteobacteria bacterium]|nr:DNA-3-methyladenine glycosylase 2 family protein [Alphaproteobacteria bacterium]MCB9696466.1 DNA-3-methyladenine glycosylase 2 family protein [Alphaproteobacteria bacterium]
MTMDPERCWRALKARDPRFDGLFYVGVTSTGIYCRPTCPARTPAIERCAFWRSAAEAESHGFRACLRCRPERAPGQAPCDARTRLVRRALTRLRPDRRGGVDGLATELGVSERHLRRVFGEELGVSPRDLLASRRVALAAWLLAETALDVEEVARASGFASARTFREAFRARTGRAPSEARRRPTCEEDALVLRLDTRPPFDAAPALAFLGARAFAGVERIDVHGWARTVRLGDRVGVVRATADERGVELRVDRELVPAAAQIVDRVRRVFDLDARTDRVDEHLGADPLLAASVTAHPGLRLPAAYDPFELAVRAVLGQQISVAAATTLAGRLVAALGTPLDRDQPSILFPSPATLAGAMDTLRGIGLTGRRAESLANLARAVDEERVDLDDGADPEEVHRQLVALPGIGPWTASTIVMRGLGWPDAFPAGDLVLQRRLGVSDPRAALARAEAWRPWRAYAALHLWLG